MVLVDDVVSTGRSASLACEELQSAGYTVAAVLCVFRFGWRRLRPYFGRKRIEVIALATLEKK